MFKMPSFLVTYFYPKINNKVKHAKLLVLIAYLAIHVLSDSQYNLTDAYVKMGILMMGNLKHVVFVIYHG